MFLFYATHIFILVVAALFYLSLITGGISWYRLKKLPLPEYMFGLFLSCVLSSGLSMLLLNEHGFHQFIATVKSVL